MGDIRSLNGYFRKLTALLVCPNDRRKEFVAEAHRMADDYRQGNPDATEAEVIEFLGPPEELAAVFLESIDPDRLRQYRNRKMWLRRGCAALFATAFFLITVWWAYLKFYPKEVEVTETLTIIIHEEVES